MKKVWFSFLAIGVLAIMVFGSSNNNQGVLTAQGTDEVQHSGFPIQPPV